MEVLSRVGADDMGIGAATIKPKSEPDQSPKPSGYLYNVSPGALFPEEHAVSSARLSERYVAMCGGLALRLIARHWPAYRAARMAGTCPLCNRSPCSCQNPAAHPRSR